MINYKEAKKILIKSKIKIKDEIINSSKSLNRINVLDIYSAVNFQLELMLLLMVLLLTQKIQVN